jgi:glycosyltransferase involved in cell wall biosynthesis
VPAWRAAATIQRTLDSLVRGNADAIERVIVVVSEDDGTARIARGVEGVEVVEILERASAGRARNVGRRHAGGAQRVLFVDADCALARGSARLLLDRLDAGDVDAAGAAIAAERGSAVGWLRHLLEFKEAEPGIPAPSPRFLPSAALAIGTDAFDRAGGFPDMWPGEDLVLCARLRTSGARLAKVEGALAIHRHPTSFAEFLRHQHVLGSTAARARSMQPMEGAFFVGRRWLAPALLAGRFARAVAWLARYRPASLGRFVALSPLYLLGLGAWTVGFAGAAGPRSLR